MLILMYAPVCLLCLLDSIGIENVEIVSQNWGPAFGANDLTLLKNDSSNCNASYSYFENISGNVLCGDQWRKLQTQNQIYNFDIKDMNTFSVEIVDQ